MPNTSVFDEEVGLLKRGTIVAYDATRHVIKVRLSSASSVRGNNPLPVDVPAPQSMFFNNGLFIGTQPFVNTPVVIAQGSGGQYYFISYLAENLPILPDLSPGKLLIQSNENTKIFLNLQNDIVLGSDDNRIHINTVSNLITTNFYNYHLFTQASRFVDGIIKRDLAPNTNFSQESKLESDNYDNKLYVIGLDPSTSPNPVIAGVNKNPPFIEQRELIYEFQYLAEVGDDYNESLLYNNSSISNNFVLPNRRKSRSDTLSLTLAAPNYLMETVKGTVVDIFGNILDLNRNPLPVGKGDFTLRTDKTAEKTKAFLKIKELERKSLAFHFELNARKDLAGKNGQIALPDINSNADYARNRSRFFIDIDKEGQFKINVPASSEKGNIPLLTRYENYSSFGAEDNGNPNKLIFREDNLDIFQDSFAAPGFDINSGRFSSKGTVSLKDNSAEGSPIDRITKTHIKHGTAYHDISATCYTHQKSDFLKWQAEKFVNIDAIPLLNNVVSKTINLSGSNANAGGRSGSINFDGSLDLNIGANSVDRQSLWLDTAGGIVGNIGRDLKNMSAALSMNGDVFIQIGGMGVSTDSRFIKQMNGHLGGALDIRVINSGLRVTLIRVDNEGVKIMTPGNLQIHSGQGMKISSDKDIAIECENLTVQGRMVLKQFGGSI